MRMHSLPAQLPHMQTLLNRPTAEALNHLPLTPDAAWRRSQEQQKEQKRWAGEPPRLLRVYDLRVILEGRQSFLGWCGLLFGCKVSLGSGYGAFGDFTSDPPLLPLLRKSRRLRLLGCSFSCAPLGLRDFERRSRSPKCENTASPPPPPLRIPAWAHLRHGSWS